MAKVNDPAIDAAQRAHARMVDGINTPSRERERITAAREMANPIRELHEYWSSEAVLPPEAWQILDQLARLHERGAGAMNGWPKDPALDALMSRAVVDWPTGKFTLPDDPFDPAPWRGLIDWSSWLGSLYRDVDLHAIDWADEMRKLPGQFTQRLYFPGSPDQRIIAEGVYEMTGATL